MKWQVPYGAIYATEMLYRLKSSIGSFSFFCAAYSICLFIYCKKRNAQYAMLITLAPRKRQKQESNRTKIGQHISYKMSRYIRWSMLISHHPPSEYDHTFALKNLRICARCLGICAGIVAVFLLRARINYINQFLLIIASAISPFPAIADFLAHEIGHWRSSNFIRLTTGTILGLAIGIYANLIIGGEIIKGIILIFWIIVLEFGVAFILKYAKILDSFVDKYENGIYKCSS